MRFLEVNQIAEWCAEHGIELSDDWKPVKPASSRVVKRIVYAEGRRSGREQAAALECVKHFGEWSECLLIVLQSGVWPSTEDWPAYYRARGAHNERRSLEIAPGNLFDWTDRAELIRFLTIVMEYGWDAELLPVHGKQSLGRRVFVSLDEWAEVREDA